MNKKVIFFAAIAASLSSGVAMAQSQDNRADRYQQQRTEQLRQQDGNRSTYERGGERGNGGSDYRGGERGDHRGDRNDYNDRRGDRNDRNDHRDGRDVRRHDGYNAYNGRSDYNRYDGYRGAGARYEFRRGGYVPTEYRGSRYVVSDWHRRPGLYAPQRGYQWVQSGNDYLLVAIATGLIANVLLN